jgi:hypothetical protein
MPIKTTAVTVSATPTRLDVFADPDYSDGQTLTYYNAGAVDVWLGDAAVVAGNGLKLAPGGTAAETLPYGTAKRYGIVATGTCQVNVDQVGV